MGIAASMLAEMLADMSAGLLASMATTMPAGIPAGMATSMLAGAEGDSRAGEVLLPGWHLFFTGASVYLMRTGKKQIFASKKVYILCA